MSGYRVAPPQCPDCGQFVADVGVHPCPGPALCRCGHESIEHVVESTRSGNGTRYGACHALHNEASDCARFRRARR